MSAGKTRLKVLVEQNPNATYRQLADMLNKEKFKTDTGGEWDEKQVSLALINEFGIRRHRAHTRGKKREEEDGLDLTAKQKEEARTLAGMVLDGCLPKEMKRRLVDCLLF